MIFTLKTDKKEFSVEYARAKAILVSALVNKAGIELVSNTHYFDKEIKDILLIDNENTAGNKRVIKPKPKNKV